MISCHKTVYQTEKTLLFLRGEKKRSVSVGVFMSQPGCVRACGGVIEKVGGVDFKCVYVSVRLCVCLPQ